MTDLVTAAVCDRCGATLTGGARFCAQCGAPVAAATTEERKVVTMLFADLAGSTQLSGHVDPERFREVVSAFYTMCTAEIAAVEGRVEKFAGDAVMAVFGVPHAHDDDAVKAIRAAIRIRDRLPALAASVGLNVPLKVRIGIGSGAVAAGSGPAGQFLVSGAPVNLSARLQQAAGDDEILVDATTQALTIDAVRYGEARTIEAKGFDAPIAVWPVEAITMQRSRRTLAMAGRRRELALLHDTFERVRETSRAHLVTLLGEAGIGKSRLVEEFVASVPEGTRVLVGRATEFDEEPTFSALAEMIRRELGVKREAPREEIAKLLHDLVAGCCDPTEAERITARLGLALGLGAETAGNPYEVAEVRAGLVGLVEGLSVDGPIAMIFEDLEIARPGMLDVIEQLMVRAKRLPVLVVCVARDALLDHRPGWGGGMMDSVTIRLEPLGDDDGRDLARAAGERLHEHDVERIVRHSGGNPFFIVETAGMLAAEEHEHSHDVPHGPLLPPTVQAVVASRIDHLPANARDVMRKASVFPRSMFNVIELGLVTDPNEEALAILEDEDLLVADDKRQGVWRFRHELLRDVAYESLPKRERMRLHLAVADGLPEPERYSSVVAYHLEQAAKAALDLNPNDRSLADRAVEALALAADVQRRRIQSRNAIDLYERALALAGPEDGWSVREARILSGIGEARYWRGEYEDAMALLERALEMAGDDTWTRAHATRFIGDIALNVQGNLSRAEWTFDEAIAAAREHGDSWTIARTLLVAAWAPYARGDLESSRQMLEEALQTARGGEERDRWAEARALTFLAIVAAPFDNAADVLRTAEESLAIGREMDDAFTIAVAQQTVAVALRRMNRLDDALERIDESVRGFFDIGAPWERASALGDRGNLYRLLGRLEEAEADLREALGICRDLKERTLAAWTASELARVLIERSDLAEAQSLLRHPSMQFGEDQERVSIENTSALVALASGNHDAACEHIRTALRSEHERNWPNYLAAEVWSAAALCGDEVAGGRDVVHAAKERLESSGWLLILERPHEALP